MNQVCVFLSKNLNKKITGKVPQSFFINLFKVKNENLTQIFIFQYYPLLDIKI